MKIIPAIDIMRGVVVRGVGGRRHEYKPVESVLATDAQPRSIGRALARQGYDLCYVADLDAIAGATPALDVYDELADEGLKLWVDAGVSDLDGALALSESSSDRKWLAGIIVGLETLRSFDRLSDLIDKMGSEQIIFSLDLKHGRPLGLLAQPGGHDARFIATAAAAAGVRRTIVVDLAAVGLDQGPRVVELCRTIRRDHPSMELIAGGGVRSQDDLFVLAEAGCNAALVASAIHSGRLAIRRELGRACLDRGTV